MATLLNSLLELDPERMADIRRNDAAMQLDLDKLQRALLSEETVGMQTLWQRIFGFFWRLC